MLSKFIGDKAFYRKVAVIATPILIQNVITNFVSLLDNIMVGQIGTEAMSGVAIVNQLIFVFNLFIFGGISGAGIFTAQFYGKNDHKGVRDTFRAKHYIVTAAVLIFFVIFITGGEQLIQLFLHEGEEALDLAATLDYGKRYLNIMLIQLIPFAIMQAYAGTLRETGETMLPMKAGIVAVFVNMLFNYILIFGKFGAPALGVEGAAIATVMARFVECIIVIVWTHAHKEKNPFIVGAYRSLKIPKDLVLKIVKMGTPLLLNEVLWSAGMTVLNQCYSLRGLEAVSAVNISSTVSNLFFCAFFSMGSAVSIIIGQLLGAGELEKAIDEDRKLIAFSVFICFVTGIVMAVFAPFIPEIYNTTDLVKSLAVELLLINAAFMPIQAFVNTCYFTLRSGGKTIITFIFDSAYVWSICIPLAFVLSRFTNMPLIQMFLAIQALDIIKCIIGFFLVKNKSWVNNLVVKN